MGTGVAVLLTCHGTVDRVEDLPAYLSNIRRGRPASAQLLAEITRRFEQIGGSPLIRITVAQAEALERRLQLPVRWAGAAWRPYPSEVIEELASGGCHTLVSLPLAPLAVQVYNAEVERAGDSLGISTIAAPFWGREPKLIDAFVAAIAEAQATLDTAEPVAVLLTGHSLPLRALKADDCFEHYQRDFERMAAEVRDRLQRDGIAEAGVRLAYQSQSPEGGAWLGPDVESTLRELAQGAGQLVIAPIGFVADHMETLYDLDVEAVELARRLGFERVARMPSMNARDDFIDALEAVARSLLP